MSQRSATPPWQRGELRGDSGTTATHLVLHELVPAGGIDWTIATSDVARADRSGDRATTGPARPRGRAASTG